MAAFWDHGYEATSMADLMAATGLQKGSIYKSFGSKHALFMQALDRYLNQSYRKMRTAWLPKWKLTFPTRKRKTPVAAPGASGGLSATGERETVEPPDEKKPQPQPTPAKTAARAPGGGAILGPAAPPWPSRPWHA